MLKSARLHLLNLFVFRKGSQRVIAYYLNWVYWLVKVNNESLFSSLNVIGLQPVLNMKLKIQIEVTFKARALLLFTKYITHAKALQFHIKNII